MPLSLLGLLVCLCATCNEARSDIYMYTDANGTPNFSNVPTDARYVLSLRTDQSMEPTKFAVHRSNGINLSQQKIFTPEINRVASIYHLDPALLHAVIATESGYDARAVSGKGAMGLMQLMPETARHYGASDPFDPGQNIQAGAQHLSSLLQRFGNNLQLALAAYNSGEANVVKYGDRIPPFPETAAYVPRVIGLYKRYQREVR
ncbi:lytic transglycosylase domain-containing protein [Sideroxydans sp. CL21]|uniref:lytic transglycosylase domain-containing protein n=1 Tax=Sideroxydans sp. CL21 TaxID=2600596 RepID=UPI0024BD3A00|nr:lytic transglycosylase domain-containing protein [Sideroxydans sp. CL21]